MSEVKRWCQYHPVTSRPVMCLAPKRHRVHRPTAFVLELENAYVLTDPVAAVELAANLCLILDLGEPTPRRVTGILSTMMDGLDELLAMKPCESVYDDAPVCIGEGSIYVPQTGERIEFEVTGDKL